MTANIHIDQDRKIIRKTITGVLTGDRSIKAVREIALLLITHKGYRVLIDIRNTEPQHENMDLMAIATECAKLRSDFNGKIAVLNPDIEERVRFAELFKACMEAQGFAFKQFRDDDPAIEWLVAEA